MRNRTFLACLIFLCAQGVCAQSYPQWGNLKPGPYAVGFRHVQKYDYARQVKPAKDFTGAANGETAYPIQIGLWYPAVRPAKAEALTYEELTLMALKIERFTPISGEDRTTVRTRVRSFARIREFNATPTDEVVEQILKTKTAAFRDAKPAAGRFPVVLAGGYTISVASVLCEYLASHGYVVLFAPTTTEVSTWQGSRPQHALNDRVRAYEFLTAEAHTLPFVDPQKLALLGVNYDGMPILLYQMQNMRASAIISINGWETIRPNNGQILNALTLNRLKMRAPYLNFHWDQPNAQPADLGLVESLKYSDRRHFVVEGLDHVGLIGNPMVFPYSGDKRKAGHAYLVRTVQQFLDYHLKGVASAAQFLNNSPEANGAPEVVLKSRWQQAALPPAPYDTELADILWEKKDVARAVAIVREARAANPGAQLFSENELGIYAFRYQDLKRPADVLAIRQLVAESYPRSLAALTNVGIAYSANGQPEEAVKAFDQALAIGLAPGAPNRGAFYYNLGCGYALAGRKEKALDMLEKAVAEGFANRRDYETDEDLTSLRAEPRFEQLLARMPKN